MNPYQYSCICAVCGEPGVAHIRDAGLDWLGSAFVHSNPIVCSRNISLQNKMIIEKHQASQIVENGTGI